MLDDRIRLLLVQGNNAANELVYHNPVQRLAIRLALADSVAHNVFSCLAVKSSSEHAPALLKVLALRQVKGGRLSAWASTAKRHALYSQGESKRE